MTEATGGITMTPPGGYSTAPTAAPPRPAARLARRELQVTGHYVARYLEDKGPGETIPYPSKRPGARPLARDRRRLRAGPTGSTRSSTGSRTSTRTTAPDHRPRKVEDKFTGVPHQADLPHRRRRPYNVLFIVPDRSDRVLAGGSPWRTPRVLPPHRHGANDGWRPTKGSSTSRSWSATSTSSGRAHAKALTTGRGSPPRSPAIDVSTAADD